MKWKMVTATVDQHAKSCIWLVYFRNKNNNDNNNDNNDNADDKMEPMESKNFIGSYVIHIVSKLSLSRNYLTPYAVLRNYNIVGHIGPRNMTSSPHMLYM